MAVSEKSSQTALMYGETVPIFERLEIGHTYVITIFEDSTKTRVRKHQGRSLELFRGKVLEIFENGNRGQERVMFELLEIFPGTHLSLPFNLLEFRSLNKGVASTHGGRRKTRKSKKRARKTRRNK